MSTSTPERTGSQPKHYRGGSALYSSATDDWATPQDFFDRLNTEFNFVLDACSSTINHKAPYFFALDHPAADRRDGLTADWVTDDLREVAGSGAPAIWMNPPYGRPIADWMRKARAEANKGATVVCLVPVRSCTIWWHETVLETGAEVRYVKGRLTFGAATTPAPFGSAVVIFRATDTPGAPGPSKVMKAVAPAAEVN